MADIERQIIGPDKDNETSSGDIQANDEYQRLNERLTTLETRRKEILLALCEDTQIFDSIIHEIRDRIRERARAGDGKSWETNRDLCDIEAEIDQLRKRIYALQKPVSDRISEQDSHIDFA